MEKNVLALQYAVNQRNVAQNECIDLAVALTEAGEKIKELEAKLEALEPKPDPKAEE